MPRFLRTGADAFAVPSRRRPRRTDVVTYRLRVDLDETEPPLWRRLEVASDLFLNELHDIVQVAFGWTDSHLHRFSLGDENFLCPFDVEEGDEGVPENEVRLDEVLAEAGDELTYIYDFGDYWQHTVALEAVRPRAATAPRAVCTAGSRPGPPEDCGGVPGYELVAAATDPSRPDHRDALAAYREYYGTDPGYTLTPFDADEITRALAEESSPAVVPEPLRELTDAVRTASGQRLVRKLLADAALDTPVDLDPETAARMVRPYTWLLDHVGSDGITLTGAGYLPPAHVEAAVAALDLAEEWIGKKNREVQTLPVLNLRESAQRAGLLRKYRGKLLLTTKGSQVRTDPVALWWQLASQTPPRSKDTWRTHGGLALLLLTAARSTDDLNATVVELLRAIGWAHGDGTPVLHPGDATLQMSSLLRRLGGLAWEGRPGEGRELPTSAGALFARAALTT
ncbi:hypothetical protein GCM10027436_67670 [Actinophytocola sediminis]